MERVMDLQLPDSVSHQFDELMASEGHNRLDLYVTANTFDEVLLYSRLTQVDFLSGLPFPARNEALVRAAVRHELKIIETAQRILPEADFRERLFFVSVTGWEDDPDDEDQAGEQATASSRSAWDQQLLLPNFWIGNMSAEAMAEFTVRAAATVEPEAVSTTLGNDPAVGIYEGWATMAGEPFLRRVYVNCPQGYDISDRVRPV